MKILKYIKRMRAIRRWGLEHNDMDIYNTANHEVQWWKRVVRRMM